MTLVIYGMVLLMTMVATNCDVGSMSGCQEEEQEQQQEEQEEEEQERPLPGAAAAPSSSLTRVGKYENTEHQFKDETNIRDDLFQSYL